MDIAGLLVDLAACLCEENTECGSPSLCFCGVLPAGQMVDMSGVDCDPAGQGWARLTSAYPSATVGQPNTRVGNCGTGLGLTVEVGIARHFPITAEVMEDEDVLEGAFQQIKDMEAARKAISCCPSLGSQDYILGSYTPIGPGGLLLGGAWTLSVGLL